jgi:NAD(P) transhydrogenase subunit alpha
VVTHAISGIVHGALLLQVGPSDWLVVVLAGTKLLIASINIVGFSRRMLAMFK